MLVVEASTNPFRKFRRHVSLAKKPSTACFPRLTAARTRRGSAVQTGFSVVSSDRSKTSRLPSIDLSPKPMLIPNRSSLESVH